MNDNKSGLRKRILSFRFAFKGILKLIKSEPNAMIHLIATIIAIACGFIFMISGSEWCAIFIVIGLVWAAESFNTVIEKLVDHLFPEFHETARVTKDIAAGAVLICAIISVIVGLIVFLPRVIEAFYKWH